MSTRDNASKSPDANIHVVKGLAVASCVYAAYRLYTAKAKSTTATQTDNDFNHSKWLNLQRSVTVSKKELASVKQIFAKEHSFTAVAASTDRTALMIQGLLRKKNAEIQQLTSALHTASCSLEKEQSDNRRLQSEMRKVAERKSSQIRELLAELTDFKRIAGNGKMNLYTAHMTGDSPRHSHVMEHVDFILDKESFAVVLHFLYREALRRHYVDTTPVIRLSAQQLRHWTSGVFLPSTIVHEIFRVYHRELNVRLTLRSIEEAKPRLRMVTEQTLSCRRVPQFNKLMVGFQVRLVRFAGSTAKTASIWDSTLRQQITSDVNKTVGNITRFFWRFARERDPETTESALYDHDAQRRGDFSSLYVEEGDLLALFAGDDDIVYAFRNGVFVAKRACDAIRFEKHFGLIELPGGSEVRIEHDLSNIRWDGVVCRHSDGDRYGNRLHCRKCMGTESFDCNNEALPIAEYRKALRGRRE